MKAGLDKAGFFIVLKDGVSGALDKSLRIENGGSHAEQSRILPDTRKALSRALANTPNCISSVCHIYARHKGALLVGTITEKPKDSQVPQGSQGLQGFLKLSEHLSFKDLTLMHFKRTH